ncbi:MAG: DMT family transporter [Chthonomonadales bacterium]|nr:DMT family transporter [Chthonomonadales bacterium]
MSAHRVTWQAATLLTTISALWAASALAAKVALGGPGGGGAGTLGPYTLAFVRFGVAGVLLAAVQRARGRRMALGRSDRWPAIVLGLCGITITYSVFYGGMRWTTATETTLLVAAEPIVIAVLAWLLLHERVGPLRALGLGIGFVGVYLIVVQGWVPRPTGTAAGNALVTAALCVEAYTSILAKRLVRRYPGLTVLVYEMVFGSLLLLPMAVWECAARRQGVPSAQAMVAIAYLTLVCSLLCYTAWFWLLPRLDVSRMAVFLFIQPFVGAVLGHVVLNEPFGAWTAAGAALVVAGVWLVSAPNPRAVGKVPSEAVEG